jgi:predicted phage-related endonuclease
LQIPIAEWATEEIAKDEATPDLECEHWEMLTRSTVYPWMGCTSDARLFTGAPVPRPPLQVKNTIFDWRGEVPAAILVQVLHELIVLGEPCGYVCTLQMGNRLRWGKVVRADHEDLCRLIVNATGAFWQQIIHREPIEPDASKSCRDALAQMYPATKDRTITLPGRFVELDDEREAMLSVAKEATAKADALSNTIREAMRDAEIALLPNGIQYTYRQGKRSRPLLRKDTNE